MDPIITKLLEGVPYNGMGSTLERNGLIGVIRNLISQDKYTVDYIINYAESVGYQRQMAEDVFKELTGLSPKLIINNNEYYKMPNGVPNMCIAWGISKSNKERAFYIVPFSYGYSIMETDGVNAPVSTVISATIPEAFLELKKVAKNIQTLDKIITKKLLETEEVPTIAETPHQVNKPYAASPLQILKKNFKDKVLSVSEFERQASKLLASEEITVDEAEDLMAWKQDLIDEDETYGNDVLELNEQWNEVQATVEFDDIWNEVQEMAHEDTDFIGWKNDAKAKFEANKELFKNVDLIEAATRLYQLLLGFSKDEILGHSKVEKKMDKKSFQIHQEKGIRDFQPWSGAKDTWKHIIEQGKADEFDDLIEELYPDGIDETKLNDLLWFDANWIYQTLGMKNPYGEDEEGFEEDASLKKKYYSENLEKALKYIEKQSRQDNNAERGLEQLAIEKAEKMFGIDGDLLEQAWEKKNKKQASKKVTAENMTLEDIEAEDNKDQVQEEIEKIEETPAEEIFSETTPEQYLDEALTEDKVDTINQVVSKCIDKFSEKFKDFDKYTVKILSYNTKVLGDYEPNTEEMVEDKELNANAILQVILNITNNADESNMKKALAVFSITNGELHWTGTIRGENDQVVAFTEEGLDALFEVEEVADQELEDII